MIKCSHTVHITYEKYLFKKHKKGGCNCSKWKLYKRAKKKEKTRKDKVQEFYRDLRRISIVLKNVLSLKSVPSPFSPKSPHQTRSNSPQITEYAFLPQKPDHFLSKSRSILGINPHQSYTYYINP